jgi:cytochrome c553
MKNLTLTLILLISACLAQPLLAGDAAAGKAKTAVCAGCHGADGNSPIPSNPKLNGQNEKYIAKQLADFKSNARPSPIMAGMVAALSEEDMANIGAFYAEQASDAVEAPAMSEEDLAIGEKIYRAGNESTRVAACIGCHGPKGNGNAPAGWPRLAGQHSSYIVTQLEQYRLAAQYPEDNSKGRRNDGESQMMRSVAAALTDREIKAVAAYIQGLH